MTDLLPCPFCGGEADTVLKGSDDWHIECHDCASKSGIYGIRESAIAAWNTRAERTCRITYREDYAPEHSDCQIIECSNGCFFYWPTCTPLFYCPKCGARVVSENNPVEVWQPSSADDVTCYEAEQ